MKECNVNNNLLSSEPVCQDISVPKFLGDLVHKYAFFLCTKGEARVLLADHVYVLSADHLCIYTPNTFLRVLEKSEDFDGILHAGEVDTYFSAISLIDVQSRLFMRANPVVKLSDEEMANIAALNNLLVQSIERFGNDDSRICEIHANYCRYLRYALCMKVCEAYFSHCTEASRQQDRKDFVLNMFLMSVFKNCHRERTVQYYADEQNLSPYYFSNIIKAKSGKSAMQWIESITMTFARQYLGQVHLSIKEIADKLHFPDQSAFGRYFKHHEGCSPTEYRNYIYSHR